MLHQTRAVPARPGCSCQAGSPGTPGESPTHEHGLPDIAQLLRFAGIDVQFIEWRLIVFRFLVVGNSG
jgi:hypothetical protein